MHRFRPLWKHAPAAMVVIGGGAHLSTNSRVTCADSSPPPRSVPNLSKPPPKSPVSHSHSEYIKGIKIYDIGIKEDPIPGEKRGKGIQHLTSSYWLYDMAVFVQRNYRVMQTMAKYAYDHSEKIEHYDFHYFINVSNALFLKAEAEGLRSTNARDYFLMACWLAMAAAEVDGFPYGKYTREERKFHRAKFYERLLSPDTVWVEDEEDDVEIEKALGKFAVESCRFDLLPSVALERLGIHNELCAIKWDDPTVWMREGFVVSARFDSMKRHYESILSKDQTEDHLAHLIWGFMAMIHVIAVFPQMNDLIDFESIRRRNVLKHPDPDLVQLVGDGGFRSGVPGRTRQSGKVPDVGGDNSPIAPVKNSFFRLDGDECSKKE